MKKMISLCIAGLFILVVVSGCTTPVVGEIPLSTEEPTNTSTPIPTSTPTLVPTATPTSVPVYTALGREAKEIAELLDWEVVVCSKEVTEEDIDKGIFLYRVDTKEFFCDFSGYMEEPVPDPKSKYHSLLSLMDCPIDGLVFVSGVFDEYIPYPSLYTIDDFASMTGYKSVEGLRNSGRPVVLRLWPLDYSDELDIYNDWQQAKYEEQFGLGEE